MDEEINETTDEIIIAEQDDGDGNHVDARTHAATPESHSNVVSDVDDAAEEAHIHGAKSNEFLAKMVAGFAEIKERKKTSKPIQQVVLPAGNETRTNPYAVNSRVIVNFIDPTTTGGGSSVTSDAAAQKFKFMSPMGGKASGNDSTLSLDLFDKFNAIFTANYNCTLHAVPYENVRSGSTGTINKLPVQTVLTRSHGAGETGAIGDVPWGGASAAGAALTDPAEWHNSPYCHVFIAACEGVEHYRTKVRPALQAFVSQIEGSSGNPVPPAVRGTVPVGKVSVGSYSPHYVIIYVPIRTKDTGGSLTPTNSEGLMGGNRLGAGLASRLTAARRQIQSNTSREMSDSIHSTGTNTDNDMDSTETPSSGGSALISKAEKELFRKFVADFPSGRPCIMSTLTEPIDGAGVTSMNPLKSQEWVNFLRTMGVAIACGFQEKCRRYDEELRRLDAARASVGQKIGKAKPGELPAFDLGHFFLVKESLAFTYEQMQLPVEALLQYEELRLFLPESGGAENAQVGDEIAGKRKSKRSASSKLLADFDDEAMRLAIVGDTLGFRRRLRSTNDLAFVEQMVLQYLFARETDLLFKIGSPVDIIVRSLDFAKSMYLMKIKGTGMPEKKNLSEDELAHRKRDAEEWAIDFAWDVKIATEGFFQIINYEDEGDMGDFSFSEMPEPVADDLDTAELTQSKSEPPADPELESLERIMASKLCDLLEFARLRFLRLGDTQLPVENPIRELWKGIPNDMNEEWGLWKAGHPGLEDANEFQGSLRDLKSAIALDEEPTFIVSQRKVARLSEGAVSSKEAYEERYLELSSAMALVCRHSGRRRLASRLQAERAELHIRNKEYKLAVKALLPVIDICAMDRWDRGHFWRLFRLVSCQRMTGKVASFLNTLTQCFGPHLSPIAPPKASEFLQRDFEMVVEEERVSGFRLGIASFLETDIEVAFTASGKSTILLNSVRKKLVNTFCNVGEDINITLTVTSYLPRPIELKRLSILLVSLDPYERIFLNRDVVTDEDAFQILALGASAILEPGPNKFDFHWKPMTTGQYILSTVQIQWKCACFHYDSAVIRKALSGIEVLPSDPTQSIELNPLFLIPGQIQPVRITFNPGTDIIEKGTVELICCDGLQVIPPGGDPKSEQWSETCSVDLPPTKPGQSIVLMTSVKSSVIKTMEQKLGLHSGSDSASGVTGFVQTMQAKVTTSYHHALYSKVDGVVDTCMETSLEAMLTTLDKPALTVDHAEAFSYDERILVNIALHCNTPVPFFIKEWDLKVPKLLVTDTGDLNQHVFGHAVVEGEQLSFGFNCTQAETDENDDDAPFLLIVLQDEFGKTFNQVLPLDLDSLYDKMRQDNEFSSMNSVTAELQLSSAQALVGAPVNLVYRVDASSVTKPKRKGSGEPNRDSGKAFSLVFVLCCEDTDWIVGGKTQGILDCEDSKDFTLEFVGIPVHAGVIKTFPALRVAYTSETEEYDLPSITVHSRNPDSFNSLAFVNHVALACSAGLEV